MYVIETEYQLRAGMNCNALPVCVQQSNAVLSLTVDTNLLHSTTDEPFPLYQFRSLKHMNRPRKTSLFVVIGLLLVLAPAQFVEAQEERNRLACRSSR